MIANYYTELVKIKRKSRYREGGVSKEILTLVDEKYVAIDKATTNYSFTIDKERFTFSDVMYAPANTDVQEDDIIEYGGIEYDVVSVVNPMKRAHHLEILVSRTK